MFLEEDIVGILYLELWSQEILAENQEEFENLVVFCAPQFF